MNIKHDNDLQMTELTDAEMDAVAGGDLHLSAFGLADVGMNGVIEVSAVGTGIVLFNPLSPII